MHGPKGGKVYIFLRSILILQSQMLSVYKVYVQDFGTNKVQSTFKSSTNTCVQKFLYRLYI
jgi:hypothetical protein